MIGELIEKISDKEYRELNRLSYSFLSKLDEVGPKALVEDINLSTEALSFGSLVDCLVFEPDEFKKRYYIMSIPKPTASLGEIVDAVIYNIGLDKDYPREQIEIDVEEIISDRNLWSTIKDPVKLRTKWDIDSFWNYINDYKASLGKEIITSNDSFFANVLASTCKDHQFTRHIFNLNEGCEAIDQLTILFEHLDLKFKCKLDRVVIDHVNKTIKPYDLKTTAFKHEKFPKSFLKFKYYLQQSLYVLAIEDWKHSVGLEDYRVLDFEFIVLSKVETDYPTIYRMNDFWYSKGLYGFQTQSGYSYKGINKLVDEYKWYIENQRFDICKDILEKNGVLTLDNLIINY